ncbi:MAG: hypothetical protein PHI71_07700, partial [Acidiphilium sp.]|nr:hypothetical protein [Acidiphilium sp.]
MKLATCRYARFIVITVAAMSGITNANAQAVPPASVVVVAAPPPSSVAIRKITVDASPLAGSGINIAKFPALVQVLGSHDLSAGGTANVAQALNRQAAGVNLVNSQANPYQPNILYHGFELSPIQGTPAGLSVYVDGA